METIIHEILEKVISNKLKLSEIIGVTKEKQDEIGLEMLAKLIGKLDDLIFKSKARKENYEVVRIDERYITTRLGYLYFKRRYYRNKKTKQYVYLLDEQIGLLKYKRVESEIEARLLTLSSDMSYELAGKYGSETEEYSRQTVRNMTLSFAKKQKEFPKIKLEKTKIKIVYIVADEDHYKTPSGKSKLNKIISIYEDRILVSKDRYRLKNRHVIASAKKETEDLWLETAEYIDEKYDNKYLEKIIIMGDGAKWIKQGKEWFTNGEYYLDKFHLSQALVRLVGGKNKEEFKSLKEYIYQDKMEKFKKAAKLLLDAAPTTTNREYRRKSRGYLLNHWNKIDRENRYFCCAEGQVSHILASRMSSRPKAWSIAGIEAITNLRVAIVNGLSKQGIINIITNNIFENKSSIELKSEIKEVEKTASNTEHLKAS